MLDRSLSDLQMKPCRHVAACLQIMPHSALNTDMCVLYSKMVSQGMGSVEYPLSVKVVCRLTARAAMQRGLVMGRMHTISSV